MKTATLVLSAAVALSTGAPAQQSTSVEGSAKSQSQTSVSADRGGAGVSHAGTTSGGVAAEGPAAQSGSGDLAGGTELNAALRKPVDARRAKPGDEVRATATEDVEADGEVVIRKGSTLIGRVTAARPRGRAPGSADHAESHLAIVFDKAVLGDGREVPLDATVQALAAARSSAAAEMGNARSAAAGRAGAVGSGRASGGGAAGGGLLGGVAGRGAVLGGAASAIGGAGSALGGVTSGAGAATRAGTRVTDGALRASAGAVGGLDAAGGLESGSKGVFGLQDVSIASATAGSAEGALITSTARNVRLDGGTRMLLVTRANAGGAGR
jgi:hypothetical protein